MWETYLLQLDSDEDVPPLMPAGVQAEADQKSEAQLRRENAKAQLDAENAAEGERDADDEEGSASLAGTTAIDPEESVRDSDEIVRSGQREDL